MTALTPAERAKRYRSDSQAESAFRVLTSPFRTQARASLEGIASLPFIGGRPLTPAFDPLGRLAQGTESEDRRDVAHSPSWRRRYGGRKVKFPPSSASRRVGGTFLRFRSECPTWRLPTAFGIASDCHHRRRDQGQARASYPGLAFPF